MGKTLVQRTPKCGSREIPEAPNPAAGARSSLMEERPLQPIAYSLQFRGRITPLSSRVLEQRASAPGQVLITTLDANGLAGRVEPGDGEEALLVSRLAMGADGSFDQSGTIEFAAGHVLAFRSVGSARLSRSPDPHLQHGAAVWEVAGGEGQFRGARGCITSNFFISDTNELTDNHFGLIFVARAAATDAPAPQTGTPPRRLGVREAWTQFRRSSGYKDLLAECALWTAPWTGVPPFQDRDCAEEFALCEAVWTELPYDSLDDAQPSPSSISARPRPRRRNERR
jgi:hypothetical protein